MNEKETGRIEAFSDGVFAVAITLLVLGIQPPQELLPDTDLSRKLFEQWPIYLAFAASFATIGIMWINHHRLFTHIKRSDNILLILNLLLLLVIVFIPFPTALVAQYLVHPDQHLAALVYTGTSVILAIVFNLLWRYASYKNRLLDPKADRHAVDAITRQYRFGPLLYLLAFGVAWLSAPVSILMCLLLALFFALPGRKPDTQPEAQSEG
jgi:TMEM175 potassium channel family protein